MNPKQKTSVGKLISLALRHDPAVLGLALDAAGWAETAPLLAGLQAKGIRITMQELEELVETNEKRRYAFNEDKTKIRAVHGHSLELELGYEAQSPPEFLYHGTAEQNVAHIRAKGLERRSRQFVHLSMDEATAKLTGMRHGKPVVLLVKAGAMSEAGHQFFRSSSNVWLTESVPAEFLVFP